MKYLSQFPVSKKFSDQVFHHTRWKLKWGSTTFNSLGINFSVDLEEMEEINFGVQIPKMFALIEEWKRRILTPIGRRGHRDQICLFQN
jgi:hypothetical protein